MAPSVPPETLGGGSLRSLVMSALMIVGSEVGDKTFLMAAIMAMKHPRWVVFNASLSSLVVMSVLSGLLGHAVPTLVPPRYVSLLASLLFLGFGLRLLQEALAMAPDQVKHELDEVGAELELKRMDSGEVLAKMEEGDIIQNDDDNAKQARHSAWHVRLRRLVSPVFCEVFVMTFVAEWGDRSQIATIALAAAQSFWWVLLGTIVGHALCTGVAVVGGRLLASRISVKKVSLLGAGMFIMFGLVYLYEAWHPR